MASVEHGRLPDFLIGGAQKSGTTTLHMLLRLHPEIFFPARPQELDFFDREKSYARGLDRYRQHFAAAGDRHRAVGQTSTQYLYAPEAAARIARHLPQVRLIFILRDPVERAWSHYRHAVKYGLERLSFAAALEREPRRLAHGGNARRFFSYADRGFYARQLERYRERFPRDRILVLLTEELGRDPRAAVDRCSTFLGVEPHSARLATKTLERRWNVARLPRLPHLQRLTARFRFRSVAGARLARLVDRLNLRPAPAGRTPRPPVPAAESAALAVAFAAENRRLESLFGLNLGAWER